MIMEELSKAADSTASLIEQSLGKADKNEVVLFTLETMTSVTRAGGLGWGDWEDVCA